MNSKGTIITQPYTNRKASKITETTGKGKGNRIATTIGGATSVDGIYCTCNNPY